MQRLAAMFATERAELEERWAGGHQVSTEDLRQGLRRYRSFFERLLAASPAYPVVYPRPLGIQPFRASVLAGGTSPAGIRHQVTRSGRRSGMPFPDSGSRVQVVKPGVSHDDQIGVRRGVDRAHRAGRARRQHMAEPDRLPGPAAPASAAEAVDRRGGGGQGWSYRLQGK